MKYLFWMIIGSVFTALFLGHTALMGTLIGAGIVLTVYGFVYVSNAPANLPDFYVGKTVYVFSHKNNVAELTDIGNLSPHKKNKGNKYYIPTTCGRLEPNKTYDLFKDREGNFYAKQVAVMLG